MDLELSLHLHIFCQIKLLDFVHAWFLICSILSQEQEKCVNIYHSFDINILNTLDITLLRSQIVWPDLLLLGQSVC